MTWNSNAPRHRKFRGIDDAPAHPGHHISRYQATSLSGSSTLCCVEVSTASSHMLFGCRTIAYGYHFDSSYALRRAIGIAAEALRLTTSVTQFLCLSRGIVPTACIMASTLVMVIAFVPQAVITEAQHGQHFFAHIRRRPWYAAIKPSTRALVRRMMQTTYNKL